MSDNVENLVLEYLRAIRATQSEHSERLVQIELQLSALGQQIGGLKTALYAGRSEIEALRRRIEHLERRLELQP